jgi:hypothetical protein
MDREFVRLMTDNQGEVVKGLAHLKSFDISRI